MTDRSEKVFKIDATDKGLSLIGQHLPENTDLIKAIWEVRYQSILLNYIDTEVLNPVMDDMSSRFSGHELGVSTILVTESPDGVYVKGHEEFEVLPCISLADMDKVESVASSKYIQPIGKAESLVKNDGEGQISSLGTGVVEGVGTMARRIINTETCSLVSEKPALAVFNLDDREAPQFLGVYPLDLTTLTPPPKE